MMKWTGGEETGAVEQKINGFVKNAATSKVLYVLMTLAAFVVLSGAADKFTFPEVRADLGKKGDR